MNISKDKLDRALNPRTVAVVGDKKATDYRWLRCMRTFQGKVYSVQIDPAEIPGIEALGFPNHQSLLDIPVAIDYVLVAVPRNVAPAILRDCIQKQVGGVGMFTSGFAETGTPEGRALQETVTQMARQAGMVLLGPNCVGLYNPKLGVRFSPEQATGSDGPVTFISQSGGHASSFSLACHANGIGLNKVVSFGNGVVLENADYLEYFAQDEATRVIAMYVEGLKDAGRFHRVLRATTPQKPVIIWKGGQTEEGKRATFSHTGSLAESADAWDVLLRQCGAIRVDTLEQMVDVVKTLTYLPKLLGDRVGLTGGSGGQSVSMADAFAKAGLRVPLLSRHSLTQFQDFFKVIGASYRNPVDMGGMNRARAEAILKILAIDRNIDIVAMQFSPPALRGEPQQGQAQLEALITTKGQVNKPFVGLLVSPDPYGDAAALKELDLKLCTVGVPGYPSYERAALALRKVVDYYRGHASG